jgi:hypothetical protein
MFSKGWSIDDKRCHFDFQQKKTFHDDYCSRADRCLCAQKLLRKLYPIRLEPLFKKYNSKLPFYQK